MSLVEGVILVAAGLAAGFLNAVAGGGGVVTVPIVVELVGVQTANGTIRIAILLANLTALATYQRGGAVQWRRIGPLIPTTVAGAAIGAWLATDVDPDLLRLVFVGVMLLVAGSVLLRPGRWLEESTASLPFPVVVVVFAAIGFYGGFIQVGVGLLLLTGLVLGTGLNLLSGNAAKVALIAVYTPVALVLFANAAQVDVAVGVVLAVGQMIGAFIGARLALVKGAVWIRWILVVAALIAAARLALS